MAATTEQFREVTDANGRTYRIGETPETLTGRSRGYMIWLPWLAMAAISAFEYAYGSAESTLEQTYHWSSTEAFWITSVWAFFQAGIAFPAGRLREKGTFSARAAVLTGAVLCLVAYLAIANTGNLLAVMALYSVLGGVGAGIIYATCINMVGKWYPEKRGARTGFVNGGFAYGAVPLIYVFNYHFGPGNYRLVLTLVGFYMLLVLGVCGWFFKDPPKNWWPAEVDPLRRGADNPSARRSLEKNPPAVHQFTPAEALRTGVLPLMWLALVITSGISLFGINFQVKFAKASDFGPLVTASSMGILSIVNGVGRGFVGWVSDRTGRRQALVGVCVILGLAQFGVAYAGRSHNEVLFLAFAFLSGFGGGAFYPMFAALVPDYFGENYNATNYGFVYSGKLVGALFGGGIGAAYINSYGYLNAYVLAGVIGLVSALVVLLLHQPRRGYAPEPEPTVAPRAA
ncbi:MAG TPA: OFA family MFS transporter [Rugosimonospora sp.]|nr:OFA family MFS transporter [Rugosimonospora sp.]